MVWSVPQNPSARETAPSATSVVVVHDAVPWLTRCLGPGRARAGWVGLQRGSTHPPPSSAVAKSAAANGCRSDAGCSAAWKRACFGSRRPPVQVRVPRQTDPPYGETSGARPRCAGSRPQAGFRTDNLLSCDSQDGSERLRRHHLAREHVPLEHLDCASGDMSGSSHGQSGARGGPSRGNVSSRRVCLGAEVRELVADPGDRGGAGRFVGDGVAIPGQARRLLSESRVPRRASKRARKEQLWLNVLRCGKSVAGESIGLVPRRRLPTCFRRPTPHCRRMPTMAAERATLPLVLLSWDVCAGQAGCTAEKSASGPQEVRKIPARTTQHRHGSAAEPRARP
jgi:hypothetical protein